MPVFHAPAHCASHSERGEQALARLVEQVNALRARPIEPPRESRGGSHTQTGALGSERVGECDCLLRPPCT